MVDVVGELADKFGFTKDFTKLVVREYCSLIADRCIRDGEINLYGQFKILCKEMPERKKVNNLSNELMKIPPKMTFRVRPLKGLRDKCRDKGYHA